MIRHLTRRAPGEKSHRRYSSMTPAASHAATVCSSQIEACTSPTGGSGQCRRLWCTAARRPRAPRGTAARACHRSPQASAGGPATRGSRGCPWSSPQARGQASRPKTAGRRSAPSRRSPARGRRAASRCAACRRSRAQTSCGARARSAARAPRAQGPGTGPPAPGRPQTSRLAPAQRPAGGTPTSARPASRRSPSRCGSPRTPGTPACAGQRR